MNTNAVINAMVVPINDIDGNYVIWPYCNGKAGSMFPLRMDEGTGALVVRAQTTQPAYWGNFNGDSWKTLRNQAVAPSASATITYTGDIYTYGSEFIADIVLANTGAAFTALISFTMRDGINAGSLIIIEQFICVVPAAGNFVYNIDIKLPNALWPQGYPPIVTVSAGNSSGGALPAGATSTINGRYREIRGL
jgi:hypothetical protein